MSKRLWWSLVAALHLTGCSTSSYETWSPTSTTDPITGVSRCVVAAYDRVGSFEFSQVNVLYPIVERNSKFGVLVGVSSGGGFRVPVGDVVWRIDQRPYRKLRQMDNPTTEPTSVNIPSGPTPAEKAVNDYLVFSQKFAQTITATSTVASGEQAKEMIAEMRAGRQLIYRVDVSAASYGLPDNKPFEVGQYRDGKLTPIPLDESFHRALAACGI